MNLHGTCQVEFRSSKRRRQLLGLSFYRHLTPDGVGQPLRLIPMDQRFESGSRGRLLFYQILLKKQEVVGLLHRFKIENG